MARPRYKITETDWLDCLDWFEHQLNQPHWLTKVDHPIHGFGLATLKECLVQWREIDKPSKELLASVQEILEPSFTLEDWGRLRKSLSARKRRRREKRLEAKPVNITLTPDSHRLLVEYRDLSGAATFSDAINLAMQKAIVDIRVNFEKRLHTEIIDRLKQLKASDIVKTVEGYLALAREKRSLANSCKIAHQLFIKRPDRESLRLVCDRFSEDLVWNEVHLKVSYLSLINFPDAHPAG
jgi:hypothetical protein